VISCQQLIDFCLDYIEGALPDDDARGFRRHLERCPDCVTFFDTYRKTPELSREALATRIPPAVHEAVRSFLRTRRDP
jgi:anti-sigma factor RsiW